MAAVAMTALALVVVRNGEQPEGATAALQLSVAAPALHWPSREAALGYQAILTLLGATGWWSVGRSRASFDAWRADRPEAPAPRGTLVSDMVRGSTRISPFFLRIRQLRVVRRRVR